MTWDAVAEFMLSQYSSLLLVAATLSAVLCVAASRNRDDPLYRTFAALSAAIAVWVLGYEREVATDSLDAKLLWAQVQYLGIVTVPVLWALLATHFAGHERLVTRRRVLAALAVPAITLAMVLSNGWHGLVWSRVGLYRQDGTLLLDFGYGTWFWVHTAYSYAFMLLGVAVLVARLPGMPVLYRSQSAALLFGATLPLLGNVLYLGGYNPVAPLDPTPFAFAVSGLAFAYAFFDFRVMRLDPVGRAVAFDSMPEAAFVLDRHDRILDLNAAAARCLGGTARELRHRSLLEVAGEWSVDLPPAGERSYGEATFQDGDGETRHLEIRSLPIEAAGGWRHGRLVVGRDVTERVEMLEEVRRVAKNYRELVESLHAVVWEARVEDLAFTYVSPQIEELLGFPRSHWENDPHMWEKRLHPEDREWVVDFCTQMVRDDREHEFEYRMLAADGSVVWVRDMVAGRVAGPPARVRGIIVDITASKELEEQARQAERLEAVGQLAAGVAHEFNNLLTAVRGYAELALTEYELEQAARDDLEEIRDAARRGAQLTGQLLAVGRRQDARPRRLDLGAQVLDLEDMLAEAAGSTVRLEIDARRGEHWVEVDPQQIELVLVNLVVNARDAMPDGGKLEIRAEAARVETAVARDGMSLSPGDYVRLVVRDEGVGMSGEVRERIFDPFYTTKPVGEGSGLGLASVYGVVRQSRGFVSVDSAPGAGTEFRILLPRLPAPEGPESR